MSFIINPLLAIRVPGHELFVLAIVVPMGLAYIVITLQARKPPSVWLNVSPIARDKLSKKGGNLSRTGKKSAAG